MNKYKFNRISFGNLSPFFTNKGGRGTLTVGKDYLLFPMIMDDIRIEKNEACVFVINKNNFRVLNNKYKFLYVHTKSLSDIVNEMHLLGYKVVEEQNIMVKEGILQRDFSRWLFVVIISAILLFFSVIILLKYNFI